MQVVVSPLLASQHWSHGCLRTLQAVQMHRLLGRTARCTTVRNHAVRACRHYCPPPACKAVTADQGMSKGQLAAAKRGADAAKPAAPSPAKRARRAVQPAVDAPPSPAGSAGLIRCPWADSIKSAAGHAAYHAYHDNEWGRPTHDDARMFELITLESAQAGLSWSTILQKREAYRNVFANFDAAAVAAFDADAAVEMLMAEGSGIVRHEGKIRAAINNAKCFVKVQQEHGSFSSFAWSFILEGKPIVNSWHEQHEVPTRSAEGDALCAAMKKKGFKFFGPTISYTFLQAAGLVNDHLVSCHCYQQIKDSYSRD